MTPLPRIMVAPNGARRGKADHPQIPITEAELVATAKACRAAGAGGLHLHVRDAAGAHSLDVGRYRSALAAIGQAVPDLFLQVTSEAAGRFDAAAQRAMIRELRPASVSVALREMCPDFEIDTDVSAFYAWAAEANVCVQHILYSPRELDSFLATIDAGVIPGRHHQLQLVLGSYTSGIDPKPGDLDPYRTRLRARADLTFDWMVCAFGAAETACLSYALASGGKVRVGFENSLWNADGSLASDNAERVREVVAAADAQDRGAA